MRTHLVLPEDLVKEIDAAVGPRKRSKFVEEAVRDKLRNERLRAALEATAGILSQKDYPEWATTEDVVEWVRKSRAQDNDRLERVWRDRG